jgi:lycopene cyclase domain-containing protein
VSHFAYLAALTVGLLGLGLLDWRYRVAIFSEPRRALLTLAIGVGFFLLWDAAGIGLGIFFRGDGPYMTGIVLAPELPLEELFFLTLLVYQTLLLWRYFERRHARRLEP